MAEKIKVLIIDDEERLLLTLAERLRLRDFDVRTCHQGQDGVEAARQDEFDLALVDLKMPGLSGEQVLGALKREHPLLEVIILTGHGSISSAVHCTQAGSYGYLQKPCETDELLDVLQKAYQRRVQRRLRIDPERMAELLGSEAGASPLKILRRLKELDQGRS